MEVYYGSADIDTKLTLDSFPPVPPDIVDDKSSSDTLANEGMRVILECQARGNPKPIISWKREDEKPIKLCKPNSEDKIGKRRKCKEGAPDQGSSASRDD